MLIGTLWFYLLFISLLTPTLQLSQLHTSDAVSLDLLVESAKEKYYAEDYSAAIKLFEKALVNHRMMEHVEIACYKKCKSVKISDDLPALNFTGVNDLSAIGDVLAQANCHKLCVESHPYGIANQDVTPPAILQEMEERQLYNFLQFAYFKTDAIKKACQAVYTYHQQHPTNDETLQNIGYYKSLPEVKDSDFVDLEEQKFYPYYMKATKSYETKNYEDVIASMERCLVEYFKGLSDCEALCYKPDTHMYFSKYYKALSEQYMTYLNCSLTCREKLNPTVSGQKIENFAANCYSYLQISYYKTNNMAMAASTAAAALLLNPDEVAAQNNMEFYRKSLKESDLETMHLSPRLDAVKFYSYYKSLQDIYTESVYAFSVDDEGYVPESSVNDLFDDNSRFLEELNDRIDQKLQEHLGLRNQN